MAKRAKNPKRLKYSIEEVSTTYLSVEADGSDSWRLKEVADALNQGGVGIIPTDTVYALVCDVDNSRAVQRLYAIKDMDVSKQLSLICPRLSDIDEFTKGWPNIRHAGQPAPFKLARACLPGPYTFILSASSRLPRVCLTTACDVTRARMTVGVRMPGDPVCAALVEAFGRPLLCTSVALPGRPEIEELDPAAMSDAFSGMVDFVVDGGVRPVRPSTVVDLTSGAAPVVLRRGAGDWKAWDWTGEAEEAEEADVLRSFDDDYDEEEDVELGYVGV